ncbi:MAG: hypothetical protein WAU65_03170 [Candidatus Nanoarchaeia archaeon]
MNDKVIKVWAKVSTIVLAIFALMGIFELVYSLLVSGNISSLGTYALVLVMIAILFVPLLNFGFFKKQKNWVKVWAKIITMLYPLTLIISLFSTTSVLGDLLVNVPVILIFVPLYYFSWIKKK